jgi:hypothetical protein
MKLGADLVGADPVGAVLGPFPVSASWSETRLGDLDVCDLLRRLT